MSSWLQRNWIIIFGKRLFAQRRVELRTETIALTWNHLGSYIHMPAGITKLNESLLYETKPWSVNCLVKLLGKSLWITLVMNFWKKHLQRRRTTTPKLNCEFILHSLLIKHTKMSCVRWFLKKTFKITSMTSRTGSFFSPPNEKDTRAEKKSTEPIWWCEFREFRCWFWLNMSQVFLWFSSFKLSPEIPSWVLFMKRERAKKNCFAFNFD